MHTALVLISSLFVLAGAVNDTIWTNSLNNDVSNFAKPRVGGWLPKDHNALATWLNKKIAVVEQPTRQNKTVHPVIQEFRELIEGNAEIYMNFHQMFEQVPTKPPYNNNPEGKPQVRDYNAMLSLFDLIIGEAPVYEDNELVGVPINAILDWPMGTPAGFTAFINPTVNAQFKKMFDVWAEFLGSPASRYVLNKNDSGWFGPAASVVMPNFTETYVCDPEAQYYGFKSWDDFFVRLFRPGVRPVISPDDDNAINAACESTVYNIARNVKARDDFWLKGQPYSLNHMLNNDPLASQFVGGTVFQGFLSATSYHRWHSPVDGVVVKATLVKGTYYAEAPATGFANPDGPDPAGPDLSQSFITATAARALVFIKADNPKIGLMCFIAVGMVEVSTSEITVKAGDRLKKGDQMGMFHFGGSTHVLIFRPETNITFVPELQVNASVPLNSVIGTVSS